MARYSNCLNNLRKSTTKLSFKNCSLYSLFKGKAIIMYGQKDFFCSGIDLNFVSQNFNSREAGIHYSSLMIANLSRLKALPLLSVAVIDGMALGGGAEIAVACDLRVMTRRAKMGFVHICMGVSTAWGGGCRLAQIFGSTKALDLLLSGRVITGEEALHLGLVNYLLDDPTKSEHVLDQTKDWLKILSNNDRDEIIKIKANSSLHNR